MALASVHTLPTTVAVSQGRPAISKSSKSLVFGAWRPALQCTVSSRAVQDRRSEALKCRATATTESNGAAGTDVPVPTPVVKIDNQTDPFATVLTVSYGDRLGELLDTVASLKNLGLNIRRAKLSTGPQGLQHKFFITDAATSEKVVKSAQLEEIRLTVLNNLLYFHPESGEELAWGMRARAKRPSDRDPTAPLGAAKRSAIKTSIQVAADEDRGCTNLTIRTLDRPGLLVDIVRVLKDVNVNVVSAEVDTIGKEALDYFYVTYHGEALAPQMETLVTNALQYYLSLAEIEKEESY